MITKHNIPKNRNKQHAYAVKIRSVEEHLLRVGPYLSVRLFGVPRDRDPTTNDHQKSARWWSHTVGGDIFSRTFRECFLQTSAAAAYWWAAVKKCWKRRKNKSLRDRQPPESPGNSFSPYSWKCKVEPRADGFKSRGGGGDISQRQVITFYSLLCELCEIRIQRVVRRGEILV